MRWPWGETQARAGQLAGVSEATVGRYVALSRRRGVPGSREFHWVKPTSALVAHRPALEAEFRERPPHTVAEAIQRIAVLAGVRRKGTQVRAFLKNVSARGGIGWGDPAAPEADGRGAHPHLGRVPPGGVGAG